MDDQGGQPDCYLTTTGRVSGRPHTIEIWFALQDRTLYLFAADTGTQSECTRACASAWPPLMATGKPTVGAGADASLVGSTTRSDGTRQVTYAGHPVYLFSGDQNPGDTNGEGIVAFGASWYAVSPAGDQITGPAPNPGVGNGY